MVQPRDNGSIGDADWAARVYQELRSLARRHMRDEGPCTIQTTALVHEAYVRLVADQDAAWENRAHFFGAAANAMRRILIDHARAKGALKRGGDRRRTPLTDAPGVVVDERLLSLHESLERLEARDARKAQVVMLRFFAGLTIAQTAEVLDLSPTTVKDEWQFARAWLYREMTRDDD